MTSYTARPARDLIPWIAGFALLALVLRVAAAQGALWLDEAWSAVLARDAGTPARVFFAIAHDNNHYANTLWLQLTGWGAPPLLSRALSIGSGTAAVVVGAMIGARRGRIEAIVIAALLAISPILVVYGAEARGYAPMLLALLVAIWLVDRWLDGDPAPRTGRMLGAVTGLGMLGHLTMLIGLFALCVWTAAILARRMPWWRALLAALQLMKASILAAVAVLAIVVTTALDNPAGFQVASFEAFIGPKFLDGMGRTLSYTFGLPSALGLPALAAAILLVPASLWFAPWLRGRAPYYAVAIFALPLASVILRLGNSSFPRYHLIAALALLLLAGEISVHALRAGRWRRVCSLLALAGVAAGSMARDATIIRERRADPGPAIAAMRARAPNGSTVLIDYPRDSAVPEAAAASAHYPLQISGTPCSGARFLFSEQNGTAPFPERPVRCGFAYRAVMGNRTDGLSGLEWQLYERRGKQTM